MPADAPTRGRSLRSTVSSDGQVRLSLQEQPLPELSEGQVVVAEEATLFINTLTALAMVETMRAENHTALVRTAAASNLGQMFVRICAADGVPLVNIAGKREQVELLLGIGAEHVVDSSRPDFAE